MAINKNSVDLPAVSLSFEPLVSVILTSYNYADYVEQSIQSVFDQTYSNLELIIVDDGSEDGSRDIIERCTANAPIRVRRIFQENRGQSAAINAGMKECNGEFVALLDSDDYWYPAKLEIMMVFIAINPDGGVYQHQLNITPGVPKRNSLVSADIFQLWKNWDEGVFNVAGLYSDLVFAPFLPTSGLMFRREVLDKVMPIPESLKACPDAYLTRTAAAHGPLKSLDRALGVWRAHDTNAGKGQLGSKEYWLETILPALNEYYEKIDAPLRLKAGRRTPFEVSPALALGQNDETTPGDSRESLKRYHTKRYRGLGPAVAAVLRMFLDPLTVEKLKRFLRR